MLPILPLQLFCKSQIVPTEKFIYFFKDLFDKKKKKKKIYLTETERAQEGERHPEGEGEADSPLSREPDVGLDPKTLCQDPEPNADA